MTQFNNQKGFATIEIFLVVMILAIISGVAVPQIAKMLDVAQLNYETKRFVSEFYFAKSLSRSAHFEPEIFYMQPITNGEVVKFSVANRSYEIKTSKNSIRERYFLPKNFKISRNLPMDLLFEDGRNTDGGTYIFTSPQNFSLHVVKDNQNRIRISKN